ncbi:hypothetical protein P4O66_011238 [Electrophorus voltai]|uniref:Reverse transcriptase domain-containing protein n=1 Tax=Electrophorus voltai TaxID=2609070 RepID=A0AAD8ZAR0_9TELE|nr:hypothetical protein P4O66_011238 [Electrophorus voltai]
MSGKQHLAHPRAIEYLVLLYDLATAPSIFQAYINEVLREFLSSVVAYIDDILICSPAPDLIAEPSSICLVRYGVVTSHLRSLSTPSRVTEGCVSMQPGKVGAVRAWQRPLKNARHCSAFLPLPTFIGDLSNPSVHWPGPSQTNSRDLHKGSNGPLKYKRHSRNTRLLHLTCPTTT